MRSLFEIACKRCNSNDSNSNCEAVLGELRATLLRRGGGVARVRIPHHARGRIRQNVDSFSHNRLSSPFFTQWVCTLVATPPQTTPTPTKTTPAPPPIGGNCIIRAATRRRYTASQLLMLQNPHWPPAWRAQRDRWAWLRCPWAVAGPGRASSRPRRAKLAARTTRGRAAAHGHTKQPGPYTARGPKRRSASGPSRVSVAHRLSWMLRPGTASISSRV